MIAPVTIGDQKFIKDDNRGWIDSKTKLPADKGLIRLLDSLVVNEPLAKKLRIKIDRSIEPVTISGQKFVYDSNQGWIDEKTKTPVPPHLQTILNEASKSARPDISASLGMFGKAGLQQTKQKQPPKTGGGTLAINRTALNKPLVQMINSLASIDGFIKQRIENQKQISKNNILAIRESQIESVNQAAEVEVVKQDAERVSGPSAGLLALGGLALLTLDPVQEAIKDIANGVVETGKFITGVISSINSAFSFLFSGKSDGDIVGTAETTQATSNTQSPAADATIASDAVPEEKPSFLSSVGAGAATGAVVGSVVPRVGMIAGGVVGGIVGGVKHFVGGGSTTPATSGGASTTTGTTPQATKVGGTGAAQPAAASAEGTTATAAGEIPKNDIVGLGNYLIGKGAERNKMQHSAFGPVGEHSKNSRHYRNMAIDVNFPGPNEAAILDALEPQLRAAGYNTIWRKPGHETHMHVSVGGPEGGGGGSYGDSNTLLGMGAQAASAGIEKVAELFGMLGSAIIKPGVPRDKEDYSKAINNAAVNTNASVISTKSSKSAPTPKLPTPPNINKIDGGAPQNPASSADVNSVYYYLRRFGYQDLSISSKSLTTV